MDNVLLIIFALFLPLLAVLQILVLVRHRNVDLSPLEAPLKALESALERTERSLRTELGSAREQTSADAHRGREELAASMGRLTLGLEKKTEELKDKVEARLLAIEERNARQLEQMRATVDEKLQGTLDKRLGESFKVVSERLEQVYKGLGEMQSLAAGVGDLKKVLTNVKTRGTWGEVILGRLLEDVLTKEQYEANVATTGTSERVEFAIRLPGRGDGEVVWLPIDSKFPMESYERLRLAQECGDASQVELATKQLETAVRSFARCITDKYVSPPLTTDFAILFVPTEGLYAELIRNGALMDELQHSHRVMLAGPTTLVALLSSLQMGFRTLAIEKHSSEVWMLLSAVKTEWNKYGDALTAVHRKIEAVSKSIASAEVRVRAVGRKLRGVEELPSSQAGSMLGLEDPAELLLDEEEA
ncbi:MAG: DNA recombination protein RmuC [Myxococcota bacterium]|jgi:DNA recombination protein RmuC|nr:DNA recombination protein RmuC [Myxococcota bacterium]